MGIGAYDMGSITARGFVVSGTSLAGVQVGTGAWVALHSGEVSNNTIGVNVQDSDFDRSRLMVEVIYRDNGVNLDVQRLPLPDTSEMTGLRDPD